ncbi:hypothetical protein ACWDR3_21560 [Streptomyces sp. NPDC001002]
MSGKGVEGSAREGARLEDAVRVRRCSAGRLRDAYPVGVHDVEVVIGGPQRGDEKSVESLRRAARTALSSDPKCRRVVHAVEEDDLAGAEDAEAAGFRHVVDVDLPEGAFRLFVLEPAWVTEGDSDLDRVSGT